MPQDQVVSPLGPQPDESWRRMIRNLTTVLCDSNARYFDGLTVVYFQRWFPSTSDITGQLRAGLRQRHDGLRGPISDELIEACRTESPNDF